MRDQSHLEQIERWACYCKQYMKDCQAQLTPFLNSQIKNANAFYRRLAKTKGGKEKIQKIKRLSEEPRRRLVERKLKQEQAEMKKKGLKYLSEKQALAKYR